MKTRELQIRQARAIRVADGPTMSVVVISERDQVELRACLDTLVPECAQYEAQLIVIRAAPAEEIRELRRAYPSVRFTAAPSPTAGSDLRALGMKAADGDIVLFQPDLPLEGNWIPPRAFER